MKRKSRIKDKKKKNKNIVKFDILFLFINSDSFYLFYLNHIKLNNLIICQFLSNFHLYLIFFEIFHRQLNIEK